jgi:hypothetical protein
MNRHLGGVIAAAIGTAAFALATQSVAAVQSPATAPAGAQGARAGAGQQVTVSGCIQREADYRKATDAGRGGVASTGIGVGNEFVLTNAMMSPATAGSPTATSGAGASSTTGTSGAASTKAYELTGTHEGDASEFVGKRVEITGMMKPTTAAPGGPTASVPGSSDLKLEELEVTTIRAASGTCPAAANP